MTFPKGLIKKPRTVDRSAHAMEAAQLMKSWNIGSLIVVEDECPVGVVTDRDIALTVIGGELDPTECPVAECMNDEVVSIGEHSGISEAVDLMRRNGIRRLPVVDEIGKLVGIVSSDDLVLSLARELADLAGVIRNEISQEGSKKPLMSARLGKE